MWHAHSWERFEGDVKCSSGSDVDSFLWLVECHRKLFNKEGHRTCILENVGLIGIAWKQRTRGGRFGQKKKKKKERSNSAEAVGWNVRT